MPIPSIRDNVVDVAEAEKGSRVVDICFPVPVAADETQEYASI